MEMGWISRRAKRGCDPMASEKQIAANRANALKSTGPKSVAGKTRSRHNAIRHGLAAHTVIAGLESRKEYEAFETIFVAEYAPQSAIEHELVASLDFHGTRLA